MVRVAILCLIALVTGAGPVWGGAWTQREGRIQLILTTSRKVAPISALVGAAADTDTTSATIFIEYGLLDDLTVGVTSFGKSSVLVDDVELQFGLHARKRLWQGEDGDVFSVQAGVRVPAEHWLGSGLGDSRPESVPEVDLRALYGRGWQTDWGDSFVSAEFGGTLRGEGKAEELNFDFTAGHTPTRGLMGLFSVFASQDIDGPDTSVKLSPSIAYTLWPWLGENDKKPRGPLFPQTIQLGVTWDAVRPRDGIDISISVWKSF